MCETVYIWEWIHSQKRTFPAIHTAVEPVYKSHNSKMSLVVLEAITNIHSDIKHFMPLYKCKFGTTASLVWPGEMNDWNVGHTEPVITALRKKKFKSWWQHCRPPTSPGHTTCSKLVLHSHCSFSWQECPDSTSEWLPAHSARWKRRRALDASDKVTAR
jgi:hypothetical protein